MIKSRKMILYTAVLKQLHTASCLSVSPSKKSDRAGQNILSDVFLSFTSRMWESKNQIPNFRLNLLYNSPANIPPQYSAVSSHHHHHLQKLLKDMTASIVSFQCCCRQAGRRLWVLFSDGRHHPSSWEKDHLCETAAMQCQMWEWDQDLHWVLRASTEVEQQQQQQWQWQQQRASYTRNTGTQLTVRGEHSCVAILRVNG